MNTRSPVRKTATEPPFIDPNEKIWPERAQIDEKGRGIHSYYRQPDYSSPATTPVTTPETTGTVPPIVTPTTAPPVTVPRKTPRTTPVTTPHTKPTKTGP